MAAGCLFVEHPGEQAEGLYVGAQADRNSAAHAGLRIGILDGHRRDRRPETRVSAQLRIRVVGVGADTSVDVQPDLRFGEGLDEADEVVVHARAQRFDGFAALPPQLGFIGGVPRIPGRIGQAVTVHREQRRLVLGTRQLPVDHRCSPGTRPRLGGLGGRLADAGGAGGWACGGFSPIAP